MLGAAAAGSTTSSSKTIIDGDPRRRTPPTRAKRQLHLEKGTFVEQGQAAAPAGAMRMKFFPLVLANLGRHKRRTFLTIASVALALFLFASLRTVVTTLERGRRVRQRAPAGRAPTPAALVFPLPVSYANRLSAVPGVEKVTWANWFGGKYGDGKRFFAQFAVDAEDATSTCIPRCRCPADQKQAFLQERSSAHRSARGWSTCSAGSVGQNVTLQGTIFPGDWTFTIRGVYTPTDPVINDDAMMFH